MKSKKKRKPSGFASGQGRSALSNVRRFFPQVTEVLDADKDIEIEVTDKDDKGGKKMDHATCALARACQTKLSLDGVVISLSTAYLIRGYKAKRYKVGEAASREIVSFDRGGGFEPGRYLLKAPSPQMRLGAHKGTGSKANTGQGRQELVVHKTGGIRAALGSKAI